MILRSQLHTYQEGPSSSRLPTVPHPTLPSPKEVVANSVWVDLSGAPLVRIVDKLKYLGILYGNFLCPWDNFRDQLAKLQSRAGLPLSR